MKNKIIGILCMAPFILLAVSGVSLLLYRIFPDLKPILLKVIKFIRYLFFDDFSFGSWWLDFGVFLFCMIS